MPLHTCACRVTKIPRRTVSTRLCQNVRRITRPSLPRSSPVDTPVVTFCGEIILLITAPDELVAAIKTGLRCSRLAATTCKLPKSAFDDVSDPDRKHAIQPRNPEKNGNQLPSAATATPSV